MNRSVLHLIRCRGIATAVTSSSSQVGTATSPDAVAPPKLVPEAVLEKASPLNTPVSKWAHGLESQQTKPHLWTDNSSVKDAWKGMHKTFLSCKTNSEKSELLENNLAALCTVSSRAEFNAILRALPSPLRMALALRDDIVTDEVTEMFVHVGQEVVVYTSQTQHVVAYMPTIEDISKMYDRISSIGSDGRACIPGTLHRVGVFRGRTGDAVGYTIRVGRYIPGVSHALVDLLSSGNVLLIAPPNHGKTTLLRDLVANFARRPTPPRVVVVDTSNEIAGDGDTVAPYFGETRRLQVPKRDDQLKVMVQAVQNHSPEILVIDEIGTLEEADAVCSMCQRGVRTICTVHGTSLGSILRNQHLNRLVGGCAPVFLSYEEKKSKGKVRKTVLERTHPCPFNYVVTLTSREKALVYKDVDEVIDRVFDEEDWTNSAREMAVEISLQESMDSSFMRLTSDVTARLKAHVGTNHVKPPQQQQQHPKNDSERGRTPLTTPPRPEGRANSGGEDGWAIENKQLHEASRGGSQHRNDRHNRNKHRMGNHHRLNGGQPH